MLFKDTNMYDHCKLQEQNSSFVFVMEVILRDISQHKKIQ